LYVSKTIQGIVSILNPIYFITIYYKFIKFDVSVYDKIIILTIILWISIALLAKYYTMFIIII